MNIKRFLSAILCLSLLLAVSVNLIGCAKTDPEETEETPTEAPSQTQNFETEEEEDGEDEEQKDLKQYDVTKFDLGKFLDPIWAGNVSYAEAAFVREAEDGKVAPIELLYPIEDIVSVRSADLKTVYVLGTDYDIDEEGRLIIIEGGDIPVLEYDKYFFPVTQQELDEDKNQTKLPAFGKPGYAYIRAEIDVGPGMSEWTLAVTYTHSAESVVKKPVSKSDLYLPLIDKLAGGQEVKIVASGDSITFGWSASGTVGNEPKCPSYTKLLEKYINSVFEDAKITMKNVGYSGSSTDGPNGGISKLDEICAEDPDLVIIAFGMNDGGGNPVDTYVNNINTMIDRINTSCPDALIVVVGTCLPNDEISWSSNAQNSSLVYHKDYAPALAEAEKNWTNAAFANVTQTNIELFEKKVYQDLTGSNSNHPNDYMHRVYAQVIIQTILGDYLSY